MHKRNLLCNITSFSGFQVVDFGSIVDRAAGEFPESVLVSPAEAEFSHHPRLVWPLQLHTHTHEQNTIALLKSMVIRPARCNIR